MVEYSDVFDEVDEFQKKAKVTIEYSAAGCSNRINLGVACAKPVNQENFSNVILYSQKRRFKKCVRKRT